MALVQQDVVSPTQTEALATEDMWPFQFRQRPWVPWLVFLMEVLALEVSFQLGILLRQAVAPLYPIELGPDTVGGISLAIVIVPLVFWMSGLTPGYRLGPIERIRRRVVITCSVFSTFLAWDYLVQGHMWSRGVLLATLVIALILPPLAVSALRTVLVRYRCWGAPVALLGSTRAAARVALTLKEYPDIGLVPIGIFDDDPGKWHTTVENIPVLGPVSIADRFGRNVRVAILVEPLTDPEHVADLISGLSFEKILILPDLFGALSLWASPRDLGGTIIALEIKNNLCCRHNQILKMAFDYALGVSLLIISLPIICIYALWIKWISPGPSFYSQMRAGHNGKWFRMWKLRTMYPDADARLEEHFNQCSDARIEWHRFMKLKNDPRILPILGNFLRKSSLDELPQLWNVVRGEMSLIGPRPLPSYHLDQIHTQSLQLRQRVKPGITGLWQVTARSHGDVVVQQALDTYYIRNWSLWHDLFILCRTPGSVLSRQGAH